MGEKVLLASNFSGYEINIHILCKLFAPVDGVISATCYLFKYVLVPAIAAEPFRLGDMTEI